VPPSLPVSYLPKLPALKYNSEQAAADEKRVGCSSLDDTKNTVHNFHLSYFIWFNVTYNLWRNAEMDFFTGEEKK